MNPEKSEPRDINKIVADIKAAQDKGQLFTVLMNAGYPKSLMGDIEESISYEEKASTFEKERSGGALGKTRREEIDERLAQIDKDVADAIALKIESLMG